MMEKEHLCLDVLRDSFLAERLCSLLSLDTDALSSLSNLSVHFRVRQCSKCKVYVRARALRAREFVLGSVQVRLRATPLKFALVGICGLLEHVLQQATRHAASTVAARLTYAIMHHPDIPAFTPQTGRQADR